MYTEGGTRESRPSCIQKVVLVKVETCDKIKTISISKNFFSHQLES